MNNVGIKAELVTYRNKYFDILNLVPITSKAQVTDYFEVQSFLVNLDGDFLSITLQVPGLYII